MLASGKRASGEPLTEAQRTYLTDALHNLEVALPEFSQAPTLKPSLTFQDSLTIDATGIVPGHGPVMHDRTYLALLADLLEGPLHDET
jgi:hypothetical protein